MRYIIVTTDRYGGQACPVTQITGEKHAIGIAQATFKKYTLYQVAVVDENMHVVFKQRRRCKCLNAQYVMSDEGAIKLKCMDCKLVLSVESMESEVAG